MPRRVSVEEWISAYSIVSQPTSKTTLLLDAVLSGFFGINVVKGQRDCRSINLCPMQTKIFTCIFTQTC